MDFRIEILDNATNVALEALWKINVKLCVENSIKNNEEYWYNKKIVSPEPTELPNPPPIWIV